MDEQLRAFAVAFRNVLYQGKSLSEMEFLFIENHSHPRRITMYRTVMIGILGISLMILTACESTTGKTAGHTADDATLTASVQKTLMGDKLSNFARINADTERGVVTLKGTVSSMEEKSRAEDLARQVPGVRGVENNLSIRSITMSNP